MDELLKIALVGTSRHGATWDAADHPAAALHQAVASEDREHDFLLHVGIRAVCDQCGQAPRSGIEPLPPAAIVAGPNCSAKLIELLKHALTPEGRGLLVEFAGELRAARLTLPAELLPRALPIREPALREALRPVVGERGAWLSQFDDDWKWARGTTVESAEGIESLRPIWDEGTLADRQRVLPTLRQLDPAAAREWLETSFAVEKADQRAALLEAFADGASPEDEPFLEARLDDRSELVRRAAALCLAGLPTSALAQRMRARANAMLAMEKTGWLRRTAKLVCTPPEEIDKDWERDGIAGKPPSGRGKRAFWAETVLALVPPAHWVQKLSLDPADLIGAIKEDPYADAVLSGWARAAARFASADPASTSWLSPLWNHYLHPAAKGDAAAIAAAWRAAIERAGPLVTAMSQRDAENAVLIAIGHVVNFKADDSFLQLLSSLAVPWSGEFGERYLKLARVIFASAVCTDQAPWLPTLDVAAHALPREILPSALEPWQLPEVDEESTVTHQPCHVARELDKFRDVVGRRQAFYAELAQHQNQQHAP